MAQIYLQDRVNNGFKKWQDYEQYQREIENKGIHYRVLRGLTCTPEKLETCRKASPLVKKLHSWLDAAITEKRLSPTLFGFQSDVVIYRFQKDTFLGIDLCMNNENSALAREIAERNGLELLRWRLFHGTFAKKLEDIRDPHEITDAVVEYNDSHEQCSQAKFMGEAMQKLYNL